MRVATTSLGRDARVLYEAYLAHRVDQPLGPAAQAFREALGRIAAQG